MYFVVMFGPKMKKFIQRIASRRMMKTRLWYINKAKAIIEKRKVEGVSLIDWLLKNEHDLA